MTACLFIATFISNKLKTFIKIMFWRFSYRQKEWVNRLIQNNTLSSILRKTHSINVIYCNIFLKIWIIKQWLTLYNYFFANNIEYLLNIFSKCIFNLLANFTFSHFICKIHPKLKSTLACPQISTFCYVFNDI